MQTFVFVTTRFVGFHQWPGAPDQVAYLRSRHRHEFHVRAEKRVTHNDRQIEFIQLKQEVDAVIQQALGPEEHGRLGVATWSCEQWATYLIARLDLTKCEVSEDGENGAVVSVI